MRADDVNRGGGENGQREQGGVAPTDDVNNGGVARADDVNKGGRKGGRLHRHPHASPSHWRPSRRTPLVCAPSYRAPSAREHLRPSCPRPHSLPAPPYTVCTWPAPQGPHAPGPACPSARTPSTFVPKSHRAPHPHTPLRLAHPRPMLPACAPTYRVHSARTPQGPRTPRPARALGPHPKARTPRSAHPSPRAPLAPRAPRPARPASRADARPESRSKAGRFGCRFGVCRSPRSATMKPSRSLAPHGRTPKGGMAGGVVERRAHGSSGWH